MNESARCASRLLLTYPLPHPSLFSKLPHFVIHQRLLAPLGHQPQERAGDLRADDERRVKRHLRDLRGRVKVVRALISADASIARTLATDREKARAFYAVHGVTEAQVRHGVPEVDVGGLEWEELADALRGRFPGTPSGPDWVDEEAQRAAAVLPGSGAGA